MYCNSSYSRLHDMQNIQEYDKKHPEKYLTANNWLKRNKHFPYSYLSRIKSALFYFNKNDFVTKLSAISINKRQNKT